MKKPEKEQKIEVKKFLPMIIGGLIGAFGGFFGAGIMERVLGEFGFAESLWMFASLLIAGYAQIIIHEGGHLVFGLLSGYRFSSFRVGSVILCYDGEKFKLGKYELMGTGGQCLLEPPMPYREDTPYKLYHAGGSLMNMIVSVPMLLLGLWVKGMPMLTIFLLVMAVIGILFAVVNGVPMHMGAVDNDGMNIITLGKNHMARYHMWLQMAIMGELSRGTRIRDMDAAWFEELPEDEMENPISAGQGTMILNRYMDAQDFDSAKRWGEVLLRSGILEIHRYFVTVELLFVELMTTCSKEAVERMYNKQFAKFCKASKSNPAVCRACYAYYTLFEQDEKQMEIWRKAFEKAIVKHPYASEVEEERELMALLEEKRMQIH